MNNYQYRCVVTGSRTPINSGVGIPPLNTPANITAQPGNSSICATQNILLSYRYRIFTYLSMAGKLPVAARSVEQYCQQGLRIQGYQRHAYHHRERQRLYRVMDTGVSLQAFVRR